jgi:hypothetical protein
MTLTKLLAFGTIGFIAYRAWQRQQAGNGGSQQREEGSQQRDEVSTQRDDGSRTNPHGDPVLTGAQDLRTESVLSSAQASPGFGG